MKRVADNRRDMLYFIKNFLLLELISFLSTLLYGHLLQTELSFIKKTFLDVNLNAHDVISALWAAWSPFKKVEMVMLAILSMPFLLIIYVAVSVRMWLHEHR